MIEDKEAVEALATHKLAGQLKHLVSAPGGGKKKQDKYKSTFVANAGGRARWADFEAGTCVDSWVDLAEPSGQGPCEPEMLPRQCPASPQPLPMFGE